MGICWRTFLTGVGLVTGDAAAGIAGVVAEGGAAPNCFKYFSTSFRTSSAVASSRICRRNSSNPDCGSSVTAVAGYRQWTNEQTFQPTEKESQTEGCIIPQFSTTKPPLPPPGGARHIPVFLLFCDLELQLLRCVRVLYDKWRCLKVVGDTVPVPDVSRETGRGSIYGSMSIPICIYNR